MTKSINMNVFLGVAQKPGLTTRENNYQSTYSWYGHDGSKWIMNKRSSSMTKWKENDIVELQLNCTEHRLAIRNTRSGEGDMINNLPDAELFAYFALYVQNDSLTFIP